MVLLDGFSPVDFPFAAKTYEELKAACDRAEIHLVIDKAFHLVIRTRLRYDRKDKGCHGRCLVEDVPVLGLKAGDRLEPSVTLPDIGRQFDNLTLFPFPVTFWRSSEQTWVYHRLPLWSERAGFTHDLAMGVDWLHTLSLGVYHFFLLFCIHQMFQLDLWNTRESTEQGRIGASVDCIRRELTVYYRNRSASGIKVTQITDMSWTSFGTKYSQSCSFKAAETNHFMPYLHQKLVQFQALLPNGNSLVEASSALLVCSDLIHEYPSVFPTQAVQDFPWPLGVFICFVCVRLFCKHRSYFCPDCLPWHVQHASKADGAVGPERVSLRKQQAHALQCIRLQLTPIVGADRSFTTNVPGT